MPDFPRPMSLDRDPLYEGTAQELDRQLQHGQALMAVVKAAKTWGQAHQPIEYASAIERLRQTLADLAALEALEERP